MEQTSPDILIGIGKIRVERMITLSLRKKGTWRGAKFPLSIAMVPKAGFEPARVSPPPPQGEEIWAAMWSTLK